MRYRYWLQTVDGGSGSDLSLRDTGWCGVPPPTNLYVSKGIYSDRVQISWSTVAGAEAYRVWRARTNTFAHWGPISAWLTNVATFSDYTCDGHYQWFRYKVQAKAGTDQSVLSTNDVGWRTGGAPPAPLGVSASDGDYPDKVAVSWSPYMSMNISCRVSRAESILGTYTAISDWTIMGYFEDTSCAPNTLYYYSVKAINADGEASWSSMPNSGYRDTTSDRDGDHMADWEEEWSGTDPDDELSFLGFGVPLSITPAAGQGVVISWRSEAARTYSLQRATNDTLWFNTQFLTNSPATPPCNCYTDRTAVGRGPYIYRVRLDSHP